MTRILYIANCPFPAPAKPKLVARAAGSETSPWKVKKDAPKISAKDVSGALRPFLSCALWRLHESIERNDANQLFLLSDQTEICLVAQKLNIIARSSNEFAIEIASRTSTIDLDTFGELEREFGVQQRNATLATKDVEEPSGEKSIPEHVNEDLSKDEDIMNNSISSEGTANTDASSIVHEQDLEKQSFERGEKETLVNGDNGEDEVKEQDLLVETAATSAAENLSKKPAKSVESIKSIVDSIIQQDSEKHLNNSVNGLNLDGVKSQSEPANQPASEHRAMRSPPESSLPQPQNMETTRDTQGVEAVSDISPSKHSTTHSTSTLEAAQEPEDSDEEVVVFIPQTKRLSTQLKPAQQSSRPSTPKEQSQQKFAGQSPQKALVKAQPNGRAARHSPNPSNVGQGHPQHVNSPTVIDPDAFGRDYRVNLNPSPRPPKNSSGHSNHRNRGSIHSAQTGQVLRNPPRRLTRTSPPRSARPQENSRNFTPTPGPASKDAPNHHRRQASRTSPRRALAPEAEEVKPTDFESRATTAAALTKSQPPEFRMVKPTEFVPQNAYSTSQLEPDVPKTGNHEHTDFVPRSMLPNAQLNHHAPGPRVYEASEFVPRPPRPVRDFKPRAPRPKVFEATEFVPRDFVPRSTVPRTQPKEYLPEPESIEPRPSINDVDYVLKSGSTRASARGRGRLWTPS